MSSTARDTLANRAFAFDSTVTAIADQPVDGLGYREVTFDVHEGFRGGDGDDAVVQVTGSTFSSDGPQFGIDSRLLVTGQPRRGGDPMDAAIARYCGFTRTYDETMATEWREAFE